MIMVSVVGKSVNKMVHHWLKKIITWGVGICFVTFIIVWGVC